MGSSARTFEVSKRQVAVRIRCARTEVGLDSREHDLEHREAAAESLSRQQIAFSCDVALLQTGRTWQQRSPCTTV